MFALPHPSSHSRLHPSLFGIPSSVICFPHLLSLPSYTSVCLHLLINLRFLHFLLIAYFMPFSHFFSFSLFSSHHFLYFCFFVVCFVIKDFCRIIIHFIKKYGPHSKKLQNSFSFSATLFFSFSSAHRCFPLPSKYFFFLNQRFLSNP